MKYLPLLSLYQQFFLHYDACVVDLWSHLFSRFHNPWCQPPRIIGFGFGWDQKKRGHHKKKQPKLHALLFSGNPRKNDHKIVHLFDSPPNFLVPFKGNPLGVKPHRDPWGSHGQTWAPENVDTAVDPRSAWHCARLPPCDRRGPERRGPKVWLLLKSGFHHPIKGWYPKNFKPTRAAYTYYVYIHIVYIYIYFIHIQLYKY